MPHRLLIAYLLIAVLAAGLAFAFWRGVYNSGHNVRRRERRARRARREQEKLANAGDRPDGDTSH